MSVVPQSSSAVLEAAPLNLYASSARYYGVFLTFRCPCVCTFCLHRFHHQALSGFREIGGADWLAFFRQLDTRGVPITLQGGEPGLHADFAAIVQGLALHHTVHIVSNLAFEITGALLEKTPGSKTLIAHYQPDYLPVREFVRRAMVLRDVGFKLEIRGFARSSADHAIRNLQELCGAQGLSFRQVTFLDWYQDRFYGGELIRSDTEAAATLEERTTPAWLLFAPDGSVYHSHHQLYERSSALGHVSNPWLAYPLSDPTVDFCGAHRAEPLTA